MEGGGIRQHVPGWSHPKGRVRGRGRGWRRGQGRRWGRKLGRVDSGTRWTGISSACHGSRRPTASADLSLCAASVWRAAAAELRSANAGDNESRLAPTLACEGGPFGECGGVGACDHHLPYWWTCCVASAATPAQH